MSLLIRGMKLPKFCRACRFAGFGGRLCELNVCMFTGESQPTLSPERMSKCPLVEIPPHGRLIDADRLLEAWKEPEDWTDKTQVLFHITGIRAEISLAPTVIPAEDET